MSNSLLVSVTILSPNHSGQRNHSIDTITPHYMAGNGSVETCGQIFLPTSRKASSNYGIGSDGRVGLYVPEAYRAWTSGSSANDHRAVTIECANLADSSLTSACWSTLVKLCADICRRNGKTRLVYTGSTSWSSLTSQQMLLTMHKWFQDTDCPGAVLSARFEQLARETNVLLDGGAVSTVAVTPANNTGGGKLAVDGHGGYNTIIDMQHQLGTYEDGIISGQYMGNREFFWAFDNVGWDWTGSSMVKALQKLTGASVDGIWGEQTSRKLQSHLIGRGHSCGTAGADGYFGRASMRALQECLNEGRLV